MTYISLVVCVNVAIALGDSVSVGARAVYALQGDYRHCSETFGNYFDSVVDTLVVRDARPGGVVVEYYEGAL